MIKLSSFSSIVIFLKKINLSINSLLEKYLNKLKFINLSKIARSNKVLLIFVAAIIFFTSYLSIPHIYNKIEIKTELENQLLSKFNLMLYPISFKIKEPATAIQVFSI